MKSTVANQNTQQVYHVIEALRTKRRRAMQQLPKESLLNLHEGTNRRWTKDELASAVYFSYHDLAKGKLKSPPDREILLKIGGYLECDQYEMNRLLAAADYAPIERFLQDENLAAALTVTKRFMSYIDLPSYVMDHQWHIHACNEALSRLFGLNHVEHLAINRAYPSQLVQIFEPGLPFYQLAASAGADNWQVCAIRDVIGFHTDNLINRREAWFEACLAGLKRYPQFDNIWQGIERGQISLQTQNRYAPGAMVWCCRPHASDMVRGYWVCTPYSDVLNFPQVCTFVPADASSAEQLRRLEIIG